MDYYSVFLSHLKNLTKINSLLKELINKIINDCKLLF